MLHPKDKFIQLRCILKHIRMRWIRVAYLTSGLLIHSHCILMDTSNIYCHMLRNIRSASMNEFTCSFHIVIHCKQEHTDRCTSSRKANHGTNHNSKNYTLFHKVRMTTSFIHYSIYWRIPPCRVPRKRYPSRCNHRYNWNNQEYCRGNFESTDCNLKDKLHR